MDNPIKIPNSVAPLAALRELYEHRRRATNHHNARNQLTLVFTVILLLALVAAFALRARINENWVSFTADRTSIKVLRINDFTYQVSSPEFVFCSEACFATGQLSLRNPMKDAANLLDLNDGFNHAAPKVNDKPLSRWSRVKMTLNNEIIRQGKLTTTHISIALPQFSYRTLYMKVNNTEWGRYFDGERIRLKLPKTAFDAPTISFEFLVQLVQERPAYTQDPVNMPPYFAPPNESRELEKFLLLERDSRGQVLTIMSRILIAFFALFLFVLIDSSPESFGLAMFLGCEAVAIVIGENWIHVPQSKMISHFCYQMGDVFRLYFFVQLSRLFRPHTAYWLFIGSLLSIPYGFARAMETQWGLDGLGAIPRYRDLTVGLVGTTICLGTFFSIRTSHLPWRKAALLLGAACSFHQALGPIAFYFPEINNAVFFRNVLNSYEVLSVYLAVLSALTNISTLENRVSSLSLAKAHGDMIEQELTLGQTVQHAFLRTQNLPKDFDIAKAHEAAVYVSGDIFFVHWDQASGRLVLLMCDVTGHGVQAALKSTACYMLARHVWANSQQILPDEAARFSEFRRQQDDFMRFFSDTPDIPTFAGIEFYPAEAKLVSYRTNFNAPLIVEPTNFGAWQVRAESMLDGKISSLQMKPGSLVVLFSDGYVDNSRHLARLVRYINEHLTSFDGSSESLKAMIVSFDLQNTDRPDDDRTLLVFSWQRAAARLTRRNDKALMTRAHSESA